MSRGLHGLFKALAIIVGALLGLIVISVVSAFIFVNSPASARLAEKIGSKYVDGSVEVGAIHLKGLKHISLGIDTVRVTYPHDRFAAFDGVGARSRMLDAGRGDEADTLISLDGIRAGFELGRFLRTREIAVPELALLGPRAFYRVYDDTTSNLSVLRLPQNERDTTKQTSLRLELGRLAVFGRPSLHYSAQQDTMFVSARFDSLGAGGRLALSPGAFELHGAELELDSLMVAGRLPADTLAAFVDLIKVVESADNVYDLALDGRALARTAWGRIRVPATLRSRLALSSEDDARRIDIEKFDSRIAYVPLSADGSVILGKDVNYLDLGAHIKDCALDTLFATYSSLIPDFPVWSDGRLSADATAVGEIGNGVLPRMSACVRVPSGTLVYKPMDLSGRVDLDVDAVMQGKHLSADISRLRLVGQEFDLKVDGSGADILGADPGFDVEACLLADLRPLLAKLDLGLPVDLDGRIDLDLDGRASLSQIKALSFDDEGVTGRLVSDAVFVSMPKDTINVRTFSPDITVNSGAGGLSVSLLTDSLFFAKGDGMSAKLRDSHTSGSISKVETKRGEATKYYVRTQERSLFFRTGDTRIFARGADISASAQSRIRRERPDSLARRTPRPGRAPEAGDVDISLDTAYSKYLRDWNLYADINLAGGGVALPVMPLRTRFDKVQARFDGRDLTIDSIGVHCGTSDLGLSGHIKGLGRALVRGGALDVKADVDSRYINVNEMLAALDSGKTRKAVAIPEEDESFLIDSLADAVPELVPLKMIVVPANVTADVALNVDKADFMYFKLDSIYANAALKDRTVQLLDSGLSTQFGDLGFDAFYSAKSPRDIAAGANLKLSEVDAEGIIHMLPGVDSLMPALRSFKGKFDCLASATTQLDSNMNVIAPSLDGLLQIDGKNVSISDAGDLRRITSLLLFKNKNIGKLDDFHASAVAHDSQIEVFPFELGVDRYKLALWGMQGLDKSMYYHVSILRAPLVSRFGVNVYGTLGNWRLGLTPAKYKEGKLPTFTHELNSMQLNISDYVRNIFKKGVEQLTRYNREARERLEQSRREQDYDDVEVATLSMEEYTELDTQLFDFELEEMEAELSAEVDAILEESFVETSKLIGDYLKIYQDEVYDKGIKKKIEKLKEQESRKSKG